MMPCVRPCRRCPGPPGEKARQPPAQHVVDSSRRGRGPLGIGAEARRSRWSGRRGNLARQTLNDGEAILEGRTGSRAGGKSSSPRGRFPSLAELASCLNAGKTRSKLQLVVVARCPGVGSVPGNAVALDHEDKTPGTSRQLPAA